jgi:hypothetical protein
MPIHLYEEWLKESEKVDPTTPPEVEGPEPTADLTPAQQEAGIELEDPNTDAEPSTGDVNATDVPETAEFEQIDSTRRAAIKAFKDKQQEFLAIPIETRKNPQSEEDKQQVKSLMDELIALNKPMKDAIAAYDKFNNQLLGLSDDEEENDEP